MTYIVVKKLPRTNTQVLIGKYNTREEAEFIKDLVSPREIGKYSIIERSITEKET